MFVLSITKDIYMKYIEPKLIHSTSLNGINDYLKEPNNYFFEKKRSFSQIQYQEINNHKRLIVLGEPGCGKSELIKQITNTNTIKYNLLSDLENLENNINLDLNKYELICFDALDEVNNRDFTKAIKIISEISRSYNLCKIIVTCRTHYVNGNYSLILSELSGFEYLLIDKFNVEQVNNFVENTDLEPEIKGFLNTKINSEANKQLKSVLRVPRYLSQICNVIFDNKLTKDQIQNWKRADFFEKAIYYKLEDEIKKNERKDNSLQNELFVSKRILEKLALVMEIKRVNQISIDDFLTFLDEIDSNISHVFLSTVELKTFYNRTLKQTEDILEFDNTEFQEYLAAKEIQRLSCKEQVLYDLLIDKDFEHIYSNWYDVLRFIVELSPETLLPLSNFIMRKHKGVIDDEFLKLLKEADLEKLKNEDKTILFNIVYSYIQSHQKYINDFSELLITRYTDGSFHFFESVIKEQESVPYHFRIYNQFKLVTDLINANKISRNVEFWKEQFRLFAEKDYSELQNAALYAMMDINDEDSLVTFSSNSKITANSKTYKTYLMALYHVCPNNDIAIAQFYIGLNGRYKEAIDGFMSITEPNKFILNIKNIFGSEELLEHFFDAETHAWGYYSLSNTMKELWNDYHEIEEIAKSFFKTYLADRHYLSYSANEFIKELLYVVKSKQEDFIYDFIDLCDDIWSLHHDTWMLQILIAKNQLIKIKEKVDKKEQSVSGTSICIRILSDLKHKENINNPDKDIIYEEGRALFPETYEEWEKPVKKPKNIELENYLKVSKENLSKLDESVLNNCFRMIDLFVKSKGEKYISQTDTIIIEKLKTSIISILDYIDLEKVYVNRTSENGFQFSSLILDFYNAIKIACKLGMIDIIKDKYRRKIVYYLPLESSRLYRDDNTQLFIELIGELSENEEIDLYEFLMKREDDYLEYNVTSFFDSIKRFELKLFSGFIKTYIEKTKDDYYVIKGLELLAEDFMFTPEEYFISIFKSKSSSHILRGSRYEVANAILIKKYNNNEAIQWRFTFLKENIYEFTLYDFEGMRGVSENEAEMDRPTFCNCLIENKKSDYKVHFIDLVNHSLSINTELKFRKYSEYLQTMSLQYFKVLGIRDVIIELRKLVDNHINKKAAESFKILLKDVELFFVNNLESLNMYNAIEKYNIIKNNRYQIINNSTDLFYLVQKAIADFKNTIENEGLYRPINFLSTEYTNEALLQKTLKISLENSLYKYGVRKIDVLREVNLYDDKRTDILVKYGFIGPIMIELKLLDNDEIQNDSKRVEYKAKLNQYIKANHCDFSNYIIFQRKKETQNAINKYNNLVEEYNAIKNLKIGFINCYIPDMDKQKTNNNIKKSNKQKQVKKTKSKETKK